MTPSPSLTADTSWNRWILAGITLLAFQFVQLGPAQPSQLWALAFCALLVVRKKIVATPLEMVIYMFFLLWALCATKWSGYERIKSIEQIIKFSLIYPSFYLAGRAAAHRYVDQKLPYGMLALVVALLFEYLVQKFQIPVIHQHVAFMQGALYGTFKERNWLAVYFFCGTYIWFLSSDKNTRAALLFLALNVAVALLSESKTVLIPTGVVLLLHVPGRWGLKVIAISAGTALFIWRFGYELTGQLLQVRLEEERGLAFVRSVPLLEKNWLGYGFGFVEAHFSRLWITVKGLGEGTNSVFSSPLDLLLIAGVPGLLMWLVFFCGVGLGATLLLAPLAMWSLLNPLHQSEIVYFFIGYLVTLGLQRERQRPLLSSKVSTT